LELVGIDDPSQRLDQPVRYLEGEHAHDLSERVVDDDPRFPINRCRLRNDSPTRHQLEQGENEWRDSLSSIEGLADGGCLAATVAVEDDIGSEEVHQLPEVAVAGGGEE
jgi:hypothetical protein